jgi:hypothetical protein
MSSVAVTKSVNLSPGRHSRNKKLLNSAGCGLMIGDILYYAHYYFIERNLILSVF